MDTKLRGDIAEQAAVLHALKRNWGVLKPVGDRLPYDLVFDIGGTFVKIQVKLVRASRSRIPLLQDTTGTVALSNTQNFEHSRFHRV